MPERTDRTPVRIVPLGGLGEFGLNCMVVEHGDDAIVIDCGVMFPEEHMMGVDRVIPDLTYLHELGDRLKGIVLTHGHEDHLGALPYVLPAFDVPVWGTRFTTALLRQKLEEYPAARRAVIEEFEPLQPWKVGSMELEALRVTHSIVDACGLAIRAGRGLVVHTGDFKLDPTPIDGRPSDVARFRELGEEGVDLLLSDSTNVERDGESSSESFVRGYLEPIFAATPGRVFVTTFASHLHRLQAVVSLCEQFGRQLAIMGRSMESNAALGTRTGHLRIPGSLLVSGREADKLPRERVCYLATGSQGEPGSAMSRIAMLEMRDLVPERGDAVIFSSRVIPGNDRAIGAVINQLYRCGAEVYDTSNADVHVSGHAHSGELRRMLEMVRPRHFVPVHGEYRQLVHHERLAIATGVPADRCFCITDGEVLELADGGARPAGTVGAGRVFVDGTAVGDVDDEVLRDRRHIAEDGVAMVIMGVSRQTGEIVAGPDFVARGLLSADGEMWDFEELKEVVVDHVRGMSAAAVADLPELQEEVRRVVRRFFRRRMGRRPVVVPYIMEL